MSKIQNILFDMGGVLIRWDPALFVRRLGLDAADSARLLREVYGEADWVMLDRGALTDAEAVSRIRARVPERLHGAVETLVCRWDEGHLQVDGMEKLASELAGRGYGLYLLSNAGKRHHEYWPKYPVSALFGDRVFISADHLLLKPEAAFYEAALARFGLDRRECLFIDDNPANAEAACRVGLDAVVFHGDAALLRQRLREKGVEVSLQP